VHPAELRTLDLLEGNKPFVQMLLKGTFPQLYAASG
jgi:hypothetical protein